MTFDRSKIVTVDGDAAFRSTLSIILELSGFDVVEFDRGEPALSYAAEQTSVDLVILDWDLPASPSIGVLQKLREQQQDIPVIIVTKEARKVCEEAALRFGPWITSKNPGDFHIAETDRTGDRRGRTQT